MEAQLHLPIESLATRDEAYAAAIDSAGLPAAARRVARWILEAGHPQVTDQGERLYAVAGGSERELAARSGIPRSTIQRGLAALASARPNPLLWRARGCLCLVASWLCDLDSTSDVVPQAPTDDWGRITLPRRSPERPTAAEPIAERRPKVAQGGPGLAQGGPTWPRSGPGWPNLAQSDPASISARAPVVVVEDLELNNNNPPDPGAVKDLARRAWGVLHGQRRPRAPSHAERLLLLRCAWLALRTDLGERWLLAAAKARPLRGDRQDPVRFFHAAAAYQWWERAAGEPAEEPEERREARRQFRELLGRVDLPAELVRTSNVQHRTSNER